MMEREIAKLDKTIAKRRAEGSKLLEAFGEAGAAPGSLVTERLRAVDSEVSKLEAERAKRQAEAGDAREVAEDLRDISAIIDAAPDAWKFMSDDDRRDLVNLVVASVAVDDAHERLEVRFHDIAPSSAGRGEAA